MIGYIIYSKKFKINKELFDKIIADLTERGDINRQWKPYGVTVFPESKSFGLVIFFHLRAVLGFQWLNTYKRAYFASFYKDVSSDYYKYKHDE